MAGSIVGTILGAEAAAGAKVGAAMMGLGGVVVGLMRALAFALAERNPEED